MEFTEPKVTLIAEPTMKVPDGLHKYLEEIGAEEFTTDAESDAEELAEVAGRLCYRSFAPGLNVNVTKVREGNERYLQNIIKSMHGSVLEHAQISFILMDVSRVFTHELVRHRIGVGISQESLRYVRLTALKTYFPAIFETIGKDKEMRELWVEVYEYLEDVQLRAAKILELDSRPMALKKTLTSAARRLAPIGLLTSMLWSVNLRTLRYIIEQRTSRHAEEEIRLVFNQIADIVFERYPAIFADYSKEMVDGFYEYTTPNRKV